MPISYFYFTYNINIDSVLLNTQLFGLGKRISKIGKIKNLETNALFKFIFYENHNWKIIF